MKRMTTKDALYAAISWYDCLNENGMFDDETEKEYQEHQDAVAIIWRMITQIENQK